MCASIFFFSSRRRHTRFDCDWSSDVCSSDLISGDGGFQMNMAEMATMVQEGLPVKMAVFNNGYLGMVRQWQQFFHEKRYSCTPIWSPDYVKLAEAYSIPGYRVKEASELADVVGRANAQPGPALVEFMIEQEANVFPMK